MSYTKANYVDGNERADGMYFLRETLGCENLGVTEIRGESLALQGGDEADQQYSTADDGTDGVPT